MGGQIRKKNRTFESLSLLSNYSIPQFARIAVEKKDYR